MYLIYCIHMSPTLRFKIRFLFAEDVSDSFVGTVFSSVMLFMSISGK